MKSAAVIFAVLLTAAAAAHSALRTARAETASSDLQPAPGAASADMFPEAIPGVLEAQARESKSHLVVEDVVTEQSALSLMSFLEVAAAAEKNATMLNKGHDWGIAEDPEAKKEEKTDDHRFPKELKKEEKKEEKQEEKKEEPKAKEGYNQKQTFMMACLRHVEALIQRLDQSYTDIHLGEVLRDQCALEGHFPLSQSDGFKHKQACEEFADLLVEARDENLKDGTINGYTEFCNRFHDHKYGKSEETPKKAEPKEPEKDNSWKFWIVTFLVILFVVCGIGGIVYYLTRPPASSA